VELIFETPQTVYSGLNPDMMHVPDNSVWAFKVEDGRLKGYSIENPAGDINWDALTVGDFTISTKDKEISLMRLKNIPRVGIFGTWLQSEVTEDEVVISPERHRFAIWGSTTDVSKYLDSCTIELNDGSPVASIQMNLQNPKQILSGEENTVVVPGMRIELFLTLGDSDEYPMGVQFIDRLNMGAGQEILSVEGRNITGKLLKDQTLDDDITFTKKVYRENVVELLDNAGITDYSVQPAPGEIDDWEYGIQFEPSMTMLDALYDLLQASLNWKAIETLEGELVVGSTASFEDIQVNSKYTFNRGSDVFSRSIVRDDDEAYSKVCCYYETDTDPAYEYAAVDNDADWEIPANKTLYVQLSKNTLTADAQAIAADIADRINKAGKVETFSSPIRPHILPGDEAEIVSDSGLTLLGVITTVRHTMGKDGFMTEFTVDSGGRMGKPKIKDYISNLSNKSVIKGTVLQEV
jgi:hypothetical protein